MSEEYRLVGSPINHEIIPNSKNMVFALIYTDEAQPYKDYDYFLDNPDPSVKAQALQNVPLVLAQMRWDGNLGFVGGNVESHHTNLLHALHDELDEEIGWNVPIEKLAQIAVPHTTYCKNNRYIHSYKIKVSYDEIYNLQQGAKSGKHFVSENCGNILLQIHEKSIGNLLEQSFSGTGSQELFRLIQDEQLLEKSKANSTSDIKSF